VPRFGFEPAVDTAIACSPRAPGEARRAVAQIEDQVDAGLMRDVKLVVSELVTNSVRHSGCTEPIRLRAWTRPAGLRIEIIDSGAGFEPEPPRAAGEEEGGRGLLILDSLAERWGVSRDDRTRVWFEVSHAPPGAGSAQAG
jgi:anti-sigma regulatory factor (Ser/Thr protein kinase)